MQYAHIVVKSKTKRINQLFTYLIPPELLVEIKPGIAVDVPFGKKTIEGVVWKITKTASINIKYKLKPIKKIISPVPVLSDKQRQLAQIISKYYLSTLSEVVFFMIPPIAKRIKNRYKLLADINNKKPVKTYYLYDRYINRIELYLKIISKTLKNNKQVMLIIPELIDNDPLIQKIKKNYNSKTLIYDTSKSKTNRYSDWLDIQNNKYQIVIGARSAIFVPMVNLGSIIIDDPQNYAYKEEQSPKYHTAQVAHWLSNLFSANLFFGSLCPTIEDYYSFNERINNKILKKFFPQKLFSSINLSIVDQKKFISWELENLIQQTLNRNETIFLYYPYKAKDGNMICSDCGNIIESSIRNDLPSFCPICKSINLKSKGIGINQFRKIISIQFPHAKVINIYTNSDKSNTHIEFNKYNIIIGTQKIFSYRNFRAQNSAIINFDAMNNMPNYNLNENVYLTIIKILSLTQNEMLIQTRRQEYPLLKYFFNNNYLLFFQDELLQRKINKYPPYYTLIKLTYQHPDQKNCGKIIKKICSQIIKQINSIEIANSALTINQKNQTIWQIILKVKKTNYCKVNLQLINIIENLPNGFKVDVDPLSLL